MKKILILLCTFLLAVMSCACSSAEEETVKLSKQDLKYIDVVYNTMSQWDVTMTNSGQEWHIDKVAFYDFDGSDTIVFYRNYSLTGSTAYFYKGYYVYDDCLESIQFDKGSDGEIRHQGWGGRTYASGYDWDDTASKKKKYKMLKEAYKTFLETNIYND